MNVSIVYGNNSTLKSISQRLLNLADRLEAAAQVALEEDDGSGLFLSFALLEAGSEHAQTCGESLPQKGLALADRPDLLEEFAGAAIDRLGAFIEGAALAIAKAVYEGWRPTVEGQAMIDTMTNMAAEVESIRTALFDTARSHAPDKIEVAIA